MLENNPQARPIGIGVEKRIFRNELDPNKIRAEFREKLTDEEIKGIYYFNKLLHLLFPNNIPEIYRAGNLKEGAGSQFEAEYIEPDDLLREISKYAVEDEDYLMGNAESRISSRERERIDSLERIRTSNEFVADLTEQLKAVGVGVDTHNAGNFKIDSNYNVVFLDLVKPFAVERGVVKLHFNTEKMYRYLATLEVNDPRYKLAEVYMTRTLELFAQLETKLKDTKAS
mgnify:CR=1 FL=1